MRVAFADPPYPGQSKRLYGNHSDYAGEVDHAELVARLETYDAWVLCTSASALHAVLPLCPAPVMDTKKNVGRYLNGTGTRVLVWVKPQTPWRPVNVQYAWEPVLIRGGRPRPRERGVVRDWIAATRDPDNGFVGAKPYAFCVWVFECLGLDENDELHDLFPGSGAVTRAWEAWRSQLRIGGAT